MKKNYKCLVGFIVLLSFFTINIKAQISGIVTVNNAAATGGSNYQTFGALASALNTSGINGTLQVNVLTGTNSGVYNEQVSFNQISGMSATNTITINGNGCLLQFNCTSGAPYIMQLNGTDYLTVNNLRMQSTNNSYGIICMLVNASDRNTFTSCTFSCASNAVTGTSNCPWALTASQTGLSCCSAQGSYNTVKTCTLFSGYYAIYCYGNTGSPRSTNNSFIDCRITDWYARCMYTLYQKNFKVTGCTFDRDTRTTFNSVTNYFLYGSGMEGCKFEGNIIRDLFVGNTSATNTFYGFLYFGETGDPANRNSFKNNLVKNIEHNGNMWFFYYNYYNTHNDYHHNTFVMDAASSISNGQHYWFYYCMNSSGSTNTYNNNLFTITTGGTASRGVYYSPSNQMSNINYNNYNITNTSAFIGYIQSQTSSLSSWQNEGYDTTAYTLNPNYVNAASNDYHPQNVSFNNLGKALLVPQDILKNGRSQSTPDIGAFEFLSNNCSGTPAANTVTGQLVVCPNSSTDLMVGSWSSDIGITYQWLSSPTSTAGPWTPIAGENSVFYTTPTLNATSYYGVQITCSLAGGGTSTAAAAVNIATTVVSQVPYLENFEGIAKPNQYPNCSWTSSSPLGNNMFTRIGPGASNQGPNSGSRYASFYCYYVSGSNYFYTNGIQLYAGITYSAGVYWKTQNYTSNNITDFSILLGTSQTTTGLVSLASTGANPTGGSYSSISNTFQVSTSGIYYVAVRCKTNGNYGTQYLSWDDLSITIPCQYNPVNVGVTASSNTVCAGEEVALTATGADTYTWNTGDIGANAYNTPLASTVYSVIGTSSLTGCTSAVTQYISVLPAPLVLAYGSKPAICAGESIVLMATGTANSYIWSNLQNAQSINVSPASTTAYTVTGTNSQGCSASSVYTVNVNPLPNISVSSTDTDNVICEGDQITLTGNGANTYSWSTSTNFISGPTAVVNPVVNTSYTVSGTDVNGCKNSIVYALTVNICEGLAENGMISGLSVYPNPTNGLLNIELNNASFKSVQVMDLTGKVVANANGNSKITEVNMNNLANGVYYVKIKTDNASSVIKVVKQ
ncbi:MAG: T9SS type A sorting domain-containing protein [Bacteroidia bacterium]|nr:T9SS type A sorting domain-containing protein [Bacteroidia bacterium]